MGEANYLVSYITTGTGTGNWLCSRTHSPGVKSTTRAIETLIKENMFYN